MRASMGVTPPLAPLALLEGLIEGCYLQNWVLSRSEESQHPSLYFTGFPQDVSKHLGVFVCARQAAAAGVSGGSSSLGNLYGERGRFQRECVLRVGSHLSRPTPSPLVGRTAMQLAKACSDAALQIAVGEQVQGACVCCSHECAPCMHVCCDVRGVRSLRLFHRAAQIGK